MHLRVALTYQTSIFALKSGRKKGHMVSILYEYIRYNWCKPIKIRARYKASKGGLNIGCWSYTRKALPQNGIWGVCYQQMVPKDFGPHLVATAIKQTRTYHQNQLNIYWNELSNYFLCQIMLNTILPINFLYKMSQLSWLSANSYLKQSQYLF